MRRPTVTLAVVAAAALIAAGIALPRALAPRPAASAAAAVPGQVTIYGCLTSTGRIAKVSVTAPPSCPAGETALSWAGTAEPAATPAPTPTPTATTSAPTPTPTTPAPTPTPTATSPPPGGGCSGADAQATCGAYDDRAITMSNGFDTYDSTNCWADPSCTFALSAPSTSGRSATPWSVRASETAGNTGVRAYPDEQQLTNNWTGNGWNGPGSATDTPLSGLASLSSSYSEAMPHNPGTIAQAAWDIWLSGQGAGNSNEVMVWVDNVNRGSGGAAKEAVFTTPDGLKWTLYQFGGAGGELIWSLGQGSFAQQPSGTVDLLSLLRELVTLGFEGSGARIGQIDFGWEICSTGGNPETFTVSSYSITATP
jgi:hypothetical protein